MQLPAMNQVWTPLQQSKCLEDVLRASAHGAQTKSVFDQIYRVAEAPLAAYVRRRIRDDADDVIGDVWLVVWRRLDDIPDEPVPWILGCARRVLADHRRSDERRGRLRQRARDHAVSESPAIELPGDRLLGQALADLSEQDREVLLLRAWEGLSRRELARALGCTPGVAATRLWRARARLKYALRSHEED
jgi:RNA polymerase sigma-70 factor (ECF subfamily)